MARDVPLTNIYNMSTNNWTPNNHLTNTVCESKSVADRRTDRRTDGRTDGQTDRHTDGPFWGPHLAFQGPHLAFWGPWLAFWGHAKAFLGHAGLFGTGPLSWRTSVGLLGTLFGLSGTKSSPFWANSGRQKANKGPPLDGLVPKGPVRRSIFSSRRRQNSFHKAL